MVLPTMLLQFLGWSVWCEHRSRPRWAESCWSNLELSLCPLPATDRGPRGSLALPFFLGLWCTHTHSHTGTHAGTHSHTHRHTLAVRAWFGLGHALVCAYLGECAWGVTWHVHTCVRVCRSLGEHASVCAWGNHLSPPKRILHLSRTSPPHEAEQCPAST